MQGHAVHALEGLNGLGVRVRAIGNTATRTRTLRDRLDSDLSARRAEVDTLNDQVVLLSKVGELFRALMDKLVDEQKKVVEGLVSEGLGAIFHDQNLSFEADVVHRANRVEIDLFFKRGSDATAVRDHPLEAFGGGSSSVASLILRVLSQQRLKRYPLLLLDEVLSAVSAEYVDATGRFLQQLCESMHIDALIVTHKPEFLEHATTAYQGYEELDAADQPRLALKRMRGRS